MSSLLLLLLQTDSFMTFLTQQRETWPKRNWDIIFKDEHLLDTSQTTRSQKSWINRLVIGRQFDASSDSQAPSTKRLGTGGGLWPSVWELIWSKLPSWHFTRYLCSICYVTGIYLDRDSKWDIIVKWNDKLAQFSYHTSGINKEHRCLSCEFGENICICCSDE